MGSTRVGTRAPPEVIPDKVAEALSGAKAICFRCLVLNECQTYALANRIEHCIWGGMTPQERKAHARRIRRKAG
jgi:hypothetical protein